MPPLTLHVEEGGGSSSAQLALCCTHVGAGIGGRHGVEAQSVLPVHLVPAGHQLSISLIPTPGRGHLPPATTYLPQGRSPCSLCHCTCGAGSPRALQPSSTVLPATAAASLGCRTMLGFSAGDSREMAPGLGVMCPPPVGDPWLTQHGDTGTPALPPACRVGRHTDVETGVAPLRRRHLQLPLGDHVPATYQVQGHPILLPGNVGFGVPQRGDAIQLQRLPRCGHQITRLQAEIVPQHCGGEGTLWVGGTGFSGVSPPASPTHQVSLPAEVWGAVATLGRRQPVG